MTSETRILLLAGAVVVLVFSLVVFGPRVREELLPEGKQAWVAIQPRDSDVAVVGSLSLGADEEFRLHAVLEAETSRGSQIFYTEASRLEIDGVEVDADRVRRWNHPGEVVILWFTVEGFRGIHPVFGDQDVDAFHFEEQFRPEWGRGWSVLGSVTPRTGSLAQGSEEFGPFGFGTQRFHVRVETYPRGKGFAPERRFASWGAAELPAEVGRFPTVVATLPGALARPSAAFGLTQVQVSDKVHELTRQRLNDLILAGVVFSKPSVLAQALESSQRRWDDLAWEPADLEEGWSWDGRVGAGDLLRVGERVVFLYRDRGIKGKLDYEDLCLDYEKGAAVRTLREVFAGGGLVDWADLG